jgi:Spy/CpxP family protein refolding chaperone
MSKHITIYSLSLILAILFTSVVVSQVEARWGNRPFGGWGCEEGSMGGCQGGPGLGGPGGFRHLGRYLDLSLEQRKQMQKIHFDFKKKAIEVEEELGQKRLERRALMESESVDWKKVDKLTDEIATARAKLEKQRMRQHHEIEKVLTPEQLEKLERMQWLQGREGGDGPGEGFGYGPGPGPGGRHKGCMFP